MGADAMQNMQNMQNMQPAPSGGCKDGNCQVPMGVDVGAYLEQQKEAQKFEQQKMAAQIKAQFDSVMKEVTMKKHKYAMGDMNQWSAVQPYDSKTLKEAKERLFAGMLRSI